MKKALATIALGLYLIQPQISEAKSIKDWFYGLFEKKQDTQSRIMSPNTLQASDPQEAYRKINEAVKQHDYETAEDLCLKIIEAGPENNPAYLQMPEKLKRIRQHRINYDLNTKLPVQRAAAEINLEKATKLPKFHPKREEYLQKAKVYFDAVQQEESQIEQIVKKWRK